MTQEGLLLAGRSHSLVQEALAHLHPVLRQATRKEQATAAAPTGLSVG